MKQHNQLLQYKENGKKGKIGFQKLRGNFIYFNLKILDLSKVMKQNTQVHQVSIV